MMLALDRFVVSLLTSGLLVIFLTGDAIGQTSATAPQETKPQTMQEKFAQGIVDVRATGIEKKALNVGDKAIDAELLTPEGEKVKLSTMWADQPLVITFYRGGWCPYCNKQLQTLNQQLGKFAEAEAKLVAITPELPAGVKETTKKNKLKLTVLTDQGNALAQKMGISFRLPEVILPIYQSKMDFPKINGDDSFTLPLAATYVIDTTGTIRYAFIDADYKNRAEPKAILAAIEKLRD